jgi:hypothetical protein
MLDDIIRNGMQDCIDGIIGGGANLSRIDSGKD